MDRHIHCLKDEYWISRKAAEEKFGIKTIYVLGVKERFSDQKDFFTPPNYFNIPKEFHLQSAFANVALGMTDDTYYPAHHSMRHNSQHKWIDFGHEHFYFYGE